MYNDNTMWFLFNWSSFRAHCAFFRVSGRKPLQLLHGAEFCTPCHCRMPFLLPSHRSQSIEGFENYNYPVTEIAAVAFAIYRFNSSCCVLLINTVPVGMARRGCSSGNRGSLAASLKQDSEYMAFSTISGGQPVAR